MTIAVGGAVFYGAAFLLRISELRDVVDLLRKKLGRGGASPKAS
jgi:hypothetical protein